MESPLHTHLLKRSVRSRIYSSEEDIEEMQISRPADTAHTPCTSSGKEISTGSSEREVDPQSDPDTVIDMIFHDDSPWISAEEDGFENDCSHTSTPDCKCGKHEDHEQQMFARRAREEVATKGVRYHLPKWLRKAKGPSAHVFADSQVKAWPADNVCLLEYHPDWKLKDWVAAIRAEVIRVTLPTVIMYLENTLKFQDVPSLKNALHTLCKAINQHQPGCRIFISNILPRVSASPLDKPRGETNYELLQAVRSTNRAVGRVFYLSAFEHLVSQHDTCNKANWQLLYRQFTDDLPGVFSFKRNILA